MVQRRRRSGTTSVDTRSFEARDGDPAVEARTAFRHGPDREATRSPAKAVVGLLIVSCREICRKLHRTRWTKQHKRHFGVIAFAQVSGGSVARPKGFEPLTF